MQPLDRQEILPIEVSEIVKTTPKAYWVRVKETGKLAYLSRNYTQWQPGRAFVPAWLHRKRMGHTNV